MPISIAIIRPDYEREWYLRAAEHVAEIFVRFLPAKFALDGMAKTNITLGRAEGKPRYAQLIKVYGVSGDDEHKYSPGKIIDMTAQEKWGSPDPKRICTSHV